MQKLSRHGHIQLQRLLNIFSGHENPINMRLLYWPKGQENMSHIHSF